ncbi:alpha/beta hydrolase [Nesterenkonia haasae]|uniref:alpha/beta hydrolase n=1 Tax=Nesterenkonia haasae TaxID=2587813 RepID=UPI0022A77E59|nr:alpha/beta hydrolase [Nesterenkonia haasae]NDK31977.1 alpha/beta hydrolase [Nesterenkonia haasae]
MGSSGGLNISTEVTTWEQLAQAVQNIGPDVNPQTIRTSGTLLAPLHAKSTASDRTFQVQKDVKYGSADEQVLDLYEPGMNSPRGIVVFVHGGAFVGGTKQRPDSPYHANVGSWAARTGRFGVVMDHRLAPEAQWPAGAEDVRAVSDWCRANLRAYDGTELPVHLVGDSSGAVHVATHIVGGPGLNQPERLPTSASFLSGVYDLKAFGHDRVRAYFGDDQDLLIEMNIAERLADSPVPQLFSVGEFDTPDAHTQFLGVLKVMAELRGQFPRITRVRAANHFTAVHAIGTDLDDLGPTLEGFMMEIEKTS